MSPPPALDCRALAPGARVLLRADLNVPMADGRVASDERIRAAVPTLRRLLAAGCRVLVLSHLGRPREGRPDPACSLRPVAQVLAARLGAPVAFRADTLRGARLAPGRAVLLENVRFLRGETADRAALGRRLAALCDVYVLDAFGCAHRAHASTSAAARHAPRACAGPLLLRELRVLERALDNPARPVVAVVGGAKVSTKFGVLEHLAARADALIVGGGIANTFAAAAGLPVGDSLHEPAQLKLARRLLQRADIRLPADAVCLAPGRAEPVTRRAADVRPGERILDAGPAAQRGYERLVRRAGTIIWNGPLGVFEDPRFAAGTAALARAVAAAPGFSIAGGGDTLAAARRFRVRSRISHLSTGGGAFLEVAAGRPLPAVEALREAAA